MNEKPTPEEIHKWQRYFAIECNNRAWALASNSVRTPAETAEMIHTAHAAACHWAQVGTEINNVRADYTLAHMYAAAGDGTQALGYARRALEPLEAGLGEDWDRAFAHLEMAHAAAAAGDASLHARHYAEARQRGAAIADEEDRKIFFDELSRIPTSLP
jgi:hypothetical protein